MTTKSNPTGAGFDLGNRKRSVLASVSGSASGWQALDWAAAESAARRSSLHIIHVINEPAKTLDPLGAVGLRWIDTDAVEQGLRILQEAARRASQVTRDIVVNTHLEFGGITATIVKASRDDSLIVVGRGHGTRLGVGSADWRIARRARGPVAIIKLDEERRTGPSAGRVVVGIDDSAGPSPTLEYAFEAASQRGVGLTVIHGSAPRADGSSKRGGGGTRVDELRRLADIDGTLQRYGVVFPDVDVRSRFVEAAAGEALVSECDAAALLVIGARSQSPIRLSRLSPVARTVLRSARSPIAIVPTPRPSSLTRIANGPGDQDAHRCNLWTSTDV